MLRARRSPFHLGTALLLVLPFMLLADTATSPREVLKYVKPDNVPAAKTRVDPKSHRNGPSDSRIPEHFALSVLCPEHTGLTVQECPSIFWYTNAPVKGVKLRLTVTTENDPEPLFEKDMDAEKATGIQRLNLKDLPKTLAANTEYKVIVAIILNSDRHDTDIVASGMIKRVSPPDKLVSKLLARPTPGERALVYARQGIWYDALAAISDQIAADPTNKELYKGRAGLLRSADLPEAAVPDEKQAGM